MRGRVLTVIGWNVIVFLKPFRGLPGRQQEGQCCPFFVLQLLDSYRVAPDSNAHVHDECDCPEVI